MTDEELKDHVLKKYIQEYPDWKSIQVTLVLPDSKGQHLAVVKAIDVTGQSTEGEICFVNDKGEVTIFKTTEDLAAALRPEIPADPQKVEKAEQEITEFSLWQKHRHGNNYLANVVLVCLGLLLGVSVTAAGFLNEGMIAGVLGLGITLFLSLQRAFNFSETAEFQRVVFTEADNLLNLLNYKVRTQSQFDALIDAFMTLKKSAASELPKGKGMETVKEMYGNAPANLR